MIAIPKSRAACKTPSNTADKCQQFLQESTQTIRTALNVGGPWRVLDFQCGNFGNLQKRKQNGGLYFFRSQNARGLNGHALAAFLSVCALGSEIPMYLNLPCCRSSSSAPYVSSKLLYHLFHQTSSYPYTRVTILHVRINAVLVVKVRRRPKSSYGIVYRLTDVGSVAW